LSKNVLKMNVRSFDNSLTKTFHIYSLKKNGNQLKPFDSQFQNDNNKVIMIIENFSEFLNLINALFTVYENREIERQTERERKRNGERERGRKDGEKQREGGMEREKEEEEMERNREKEEWREIKRKEIWRETERHRNIEVRQRDI
jgi:hypothetical protein